MAPPSPRRPNKRREDILRAARAVFIEQGADGARMDDIARRAQVSKGAVYHHFPSKSELLKALCEQEHSRMAQLLRSIAVLNAPPPQKLRALVVGAQEWFGSLKHPPRFFLLMADAAARDPELQGLWMGIHERLVDEARPRRDGARLRPREQREAEQVALAQRAPCAAQPGTCCGRPRLRRRRADRSGRARRHVDRDVVAASTLVTGGGWRGDVVALA